MNIHWHIGDVEKSRWFNTMMHDPETYGIIIAKNMFNAPWAVVGQERLRGACIDKNALIEEATPMWVEYIRKMITEMNVRSIVIYSCDFFRKDFQSLYEGLMEIPEYCRITIMCAE